MNGSDLIEMGFKPGKWFKEGIKSASKMKDDGLSLDEIKAEMIVIRDSYKDNRPSYKDVGAKYALFIDGETPQELDNIDGVKLHMDHIMKVPVVCGGSVMPDACPSGSQLGTVPVGGVVAVENAIVPGFHSADVCCSVGMSYFDSDISCHDLALSAKGITHFGPGGRYDMIQYSAHLIGKLISEFENNPFLSGLEKIAVENFATQGDGNHFLMTGKTGLNSKKTAIVTHHCSRKLGALLYKRGISAAIAQTSEKYQGIAPHQAWLDLSTELGRQYYDALEVVGRWTKESHFTIHKMIVRANNLIMDDFIWNAHNFVFKRSDNQNVYYHAKGATPSWCGEFEGMAKEKLVPLNMRNGVAIVVAADDAPSEALGFLPHGAGRNISRGAYQKSVTSDTPTAIEDQVSRYGKNVIFYTGIPDVTELPDAYKSSEQIIAAIENMKLGVITDFVNAGTSIMAGKYNSYSKEKKQ